MRLIITRPAAQALPWVQALRDRGVDAVALPLIGIEPAPDPAALRAAWLHLGGAALAMFVSPNAVTHFFEARPDGKAWPAATLAGSTGPGTTAALRAAGLSPQAIVEPAAGGPFDTEALWQQLAQRHWQGQRVLIVRGDGGRDWFAQQLQAAGAQVQFVAAYRRQAPALDAGLVQAALQQPAAHGWHFSSSEAIEHLVAATAGADWSACRAYATHPRIADTARRLGFGHVTLVGVALDDLLSQWHRDGGMGASIESPAQ